MSVQKQIWIDPACFCNYNDDYVHLECDSCHQPYHKSNKDSIIQGCICDWFIIFRNDINSWKISSEYEAIGYICDLFDPIDEYDYDKRSLDEALPNDEEDYDYEEECDDSYVDEGCYSEDDRDEYDEYNYEDDEDDEDDDDAE